MSFNSSPSRASVSLSSPSMAESSDTDATSPRSSTSHDEISTIPDTKTDISPNIQSNKLPWILHQILECQLSCELPLRLMFSYNSGHKLPSLKQAHRWWQYGEQGKLIIQFLSSQDKVTASLEDATTEDLKNPSRGLSESSNLDHHPKDRFMDAGNDVLLDIDFSSPEHVRRQSEGMPPNFVQKLCLNSIFTEEYKDADFAQALTGLDYIRDLEATRRASLREAAHRLGITMKNWRDVLVEDPDAKLWVENMQALELDIAVYYAIIFVDLRIWTMINELQSKHFYKPNVLAMLNTLFPPCIRDLPNDKIDKTVLHKHRANFYQYVLGVEKEGVSILRHLVETLLRPGTKHSWPETRKNLELYFERADNMIKASTAVHGIEFFRDRTSKSSADTPSLSERPNTSDSTNTTGNSQHSRRSQLSISTSIPRSPAMTFDSSKSRQRIHSRRKISTPVEQNTYFELPDSPWVSQQNFRNSGNSRQTSGSGTSSIGTAARSFTPLADTSSFMSRARAESRPTTPLIEQGSEAAQHESFTRPITPFEDKRQEVIAYRDTVSTRPATSFEIGHSFSHTPETAPYYDGNGRLGSRKTTMRSVKTPLPNDNLEFLKRPYEPKPRPLPPIPTEIASKKSGFGSLFLRKKRSTTSIAELGNNFNDGQNALGIEMAPLEASRSVEDFPRFSQDVTSVRSSLRKKLSSNDLEKSETMNTMHSFRSRTPSGAVGSALPEIAEDDKLKQMLRNKGSLPNLRSKVFYEKATEFCGGIDHHFVETGDDYERYRHIPVPRPPRPPRPTTTSDTKKQASKEVHKAKSFPSIRSWAMAGTTEKQKLVRPRKSSVFRREPQEGDVIRSKTISEPFPMKLHDNPALLKPESQQKEYTRRWFLEETRARRYDLNRPAGDPIKEEPRQPQQSQKASKFSFLKKPQLPVVLPEFEYPRATPKLPTKPNKQRWDSIFPRRALPPRPKPTTHTAIDLGKYVKYPGMDKILN